MKFLTSSTNLCDHIPTARSTQSGTASMKAVRIACTRVLVRHGTSLGIGQRQTGVTGFNPARIPEGSSSAYRCWYRHGAPKAGGRGGHDPGSGPRRRHRPIHRKPECHLVTHIPTRHNDSRCEAIIQNAEWPTFVPVFVCVSKTVEPAVPSPASMLGAVTPSPAPTGLSVPTGLEIADWAFGRLEADASKTASNLRTTFCVPRDLVRSHAQTLARRRPGSKPMIPERSPPLASTRLASRCTSERIPPSPTSIRPP